MSLEQQHGAEAVALRSHCEKVTLHLLARTVGTFDQISNAVLSRLCPLTALIGFKFACNKLYNRASLSLTLMHLITGRDG